MLNRLVSSDLASPAHNPSVHPRSVLDECLCILLAYCVINLLVNKCSSFFFSVDPFSKKDWYDVKAPAMFNIRNLGKTLVTRTQGTSKLAQYKILVWVYEQ